MKQHKHHKLYVFRNILLLLSVIAALTAGGRLWKLAEKGVVPAAAAHERWESNYGKLPLSFEPNRGQASKAVEFLARGDGYNLSLLANEAVLKLDKPASGTKAKAATATLRIKLVGANQKPQISGVESLQGKTNYLIGPDPKKWQTDVPTYAKVKYEKVYPGVDAVFYGNQRQLEYDFIVAPGADPQAIRLDFAGATSVRLDGNGELVLATTAGEVRQHRPVVYQEISGTRQAVAGSYKLKGNQASFELGKYDASHPLVIDPVVSYATFLGEANKDNIRGIAVDVAGNVYLTGSTSSDSFPITSVILPPGGGISQQAYLLFVTKLNTTGTAVIYSTLINGTQGSRLTPAAISVGGGITVDAQGRASVGGYTTATDFPTTPGAYKTTLANTPEKSHGGFALRLNSSGNALQASTLLGGNRNDALTNLALDPEGNFCVAGNTGSSDFPNSDPVIGRVGPTGAAAFVARISADGTRLIHANVLDAGGQDVAQGIATDAAGNIYITGTTQDGLHPNEPAIRFPRTQGAYQYPDVVIPGRGRRQDNAFIAKFRPTGQLIYSSVLGAGRPTNIAIDRDGNPCIVGWSVFIDGVGIFGEPDYQQFDVFPRTDSTTVVQDSPTLGPVGPGAMLLKLNAAGTAVLVSHRFGYPNLPYAADVAVDAQGFIHVTGDTTTGFISPEGPVELEDLSAAFPYPIGYSYTYHLKFTPDGKTVAGVDFLRSTQGLALALDPAGNAYILGWAGQGFSATPGALQTQFPQGPWAPGAQPALAFIAKLGNAINPGATPTPTPSTDFTISGRVTNPAGKPVSGVTVFLHGVVERSQIIGGDGRYSFQNVPRGGPYTIDGATLTGAPLHPERYVFQTLSANPAVDFVTRPPAQALTNLSAASYAGNLAADSIVTAFGVNLATATQVAMSSPLPTQLSGTSVKVRDALGVERLAPLFFVSPTQLNYLTPSGTAAGLAIVTVTSGSGTVSSAMADVEPVAPGLFTADASGRGLASAVVFRVKANGEQSYEPVAVFDGAQSKMVGVPIDPGPQGDQVFLLLFGTGFRNNSGMGNVTAQLGGVNAQASFAGAQGGFAGLDQANVLLPRSLAGRGETNLVLSVDGKTANTVKLWIK